MIQILWAESDEAMYTVDISPSTKFVQVTPCDGEAFLLEPSEARQLAEALLLQAAWIEREHGGA